MSESEEIICTLFEGNFHLGVVGLANSLHAVGFKGALIAGYRGDLPTWCSPLKGQRIGELDVQTFQAKALTIHFVEVQTDYHLTNYKPDFLMLAAAAFPKAKRLYYFDPDIVLTSTWDYYQAWIESGVALCADINSPIPKSHPQRIAWRRYFAERGFELNFKDSIYVNGGFVGLRREQMDFLQLWQVLQEVMAPSIGGLNKSSIGKSGTPRPVAEDAIDAFRKTDQDALNATVEAYTGEFSMIGQEAMAFGPGKTQMAHSQGRYKPWSKAYFHTTLIGRPPSFAEKEYWKHVSSPIQLISPLKLKLIQFKLSLCAFIGRFYRRA